VKDHLLGAKEHLLAGLLGDGGNCGCPCRDYYVAKCSVEYVEQCYQAGPFRHSSPTWPPVIYKKTLALFLLSFTQSFGYHFEQCSSAVLSLYSYCAQEPRSI